MYKMLLGISIEASNQRVGADTVIIGYQFLMFSRIWLGGGGRLEG